MMGRAATSRTRSRGTQCPVDLSRLIRYEEVKNGPWYRVGSGDSRAGGIGQVIGVLSLKHSQGYEVVLQLTDGKIDTFSPLQLFLMQDHEIANTGGARQLQLVL